MDQTESTEMDHFVWARGVIAPNRINKKIALFAGQVKLCGKRLSTHEPDVEADVKN